MIGQRKELSLEVQQWIGENLSITNALIDIPAFSSPQGFYDEIVRRIQKQGSHFLLFWAFFLSLTFQLFVMMEWAILIASSPYY